MNDSDLRRLNEPDHGLTRDRHHDLKEQLMATIFDEEPAVENHRAPVKLKDRRRSKIAVGAAVAFLGVSMVAWNTFEDGEIREIPRESAIEEGTADGYDWWLIPSAAIGRTDRCGVVNRGAEIVSADSNKPGQEWNTMGVQYGEALASNAPCDPNAAVSVDIDTDAWLEDSSLADAGMTRLGDNDNPDSPRGAAFAVHPTVDSIDVSVDFAEPFKISTVAMPDSPDGPRYAATTVDADACIVIATLLSNEEAVGSKSWDLCNDS